MQRILTISALCLLPLANASAQNQAADDYPSLPVAAINQVDTSRDVDPSAEDVSITQHVETQSAITPFSALRELSLKPGVNEVIPIAVSHTNRIILPFEDPRIRTTSDAGFDIDGRALYVTSHEEGRPVTAFINEAGKPEIALSVTFVPSRMPPVEITLDIDRGSLPIGATLGSKKAERWEESQPYVRTIRDVMRSVAIGETPSGYTLIEGVNEIPFSGCLQQGIKFNFGNGQRLEGHNLTVNVGVMMNVTEQVIEFREPSCASGNVKAVAAWPRPILNPGEASEVYVVTEVERIAEEKNYGVRRSLLGEN